jgi:tetratricopeptide (TPR) repeat protein
VNSKQLLLSFFLGLWVYTTAAQSDQGAIYLNEKTTSIYTQLGQRYADTALQLSPQNAEIFRHRAVPYLKNGDLGIWVANIDKAVALDPKSTLAYRGFCKAIFVKDYENALADFDAAQSFYPNDMLFLMDHSYPFFKGICHLELGHLDSAKILIQKSVDWQLKNKGVEWTHYVDFFYLAVINWELKNTEEALFYIDLSLKNYPQFPDANYYKALILNHLGKKSEALEYVSNVESNWKKGYRMNEDNEIYSNYPRQIGIGELADLKAILAH